MNRPVFPLVVAALVGAAWLTPARLHSQEQPPAAPKTALARLVALKAANAELLQKQEKSLEKLDELQKQADQLRIWTKRS